jgi:hypothetical protein
LVFWEGGQIDLHQNIVGFRIKGEWGIGGLKLKWKRLMKHFDSTKEIYIHLFRATTLLINFL